MWPLFIFHGRHCNQEIGGGTSKWLGFDKSFNFFLRDFSKEPAGVKWLAFLGASEKPTWYPTLRGEGWPCGEALDSDEGPLKISFLFHALLVWLEGRGQVIRGGLASGLCWAVQECPQPAGFDQHMPCPPPPLPPPTKGGTYVLFAPKLT